MTLTDIAEKCGHLHLFDTKTASQAAPQDFRVTVKWSPEVGAYAAQVEAPGPDVVSQGKNLEVLFRRLADVLELERVYLAQQDDLV